MIKNSLNGPVPQKETIPFCDLRLTFMGLHSPDDAAGLDHVERPQPHQENMQLLFDSIHYSIKLISLHRVSSVPMFL